MISSTCGNNDGCIYEPEVYNICFLHAVNHVTSFERWFIVNGVHWMGSPLHSGPQLLYREGNQTEELHQLPQNMNLNKKNERNYLRNMCNNQHNPIAGLHLETYRGERNIIFQATTFSYTSVHVFSACTCTVCYDKFFREANSPPLQ